MSRGRLIVAVLVALVVGVSAGVLISLGESGDSATTSASVPVSSVGWITGPKAYGGRELPVDNDCQASFDISILYRHMKRLKTPRSRERK